MIFRWMWVDLAKEEFSFKVQLEKSFRWKIIGIVWGWSSSSSCKWCHPWRYDARACEVYDTNQIFCSVAAAASSHHQVFQLQLKNAANFWTFFPQTLSTKAVAKIWTVFAKTLLKYKATIKNPSLWLNVNGSSYSSWMFILLRPTAKF